MKIKTFVSALIACIAVTITSFCSTWEGSNETGWRLKLDDGTYATNQWIRDLSDDSYYYFDSNSMMMHDCWINGTRYVGSDGRMLSETITPDGYYVDFNGNWVEHPEQHIVFDRIVEALRAEYVDKQMSEYSVITKVRGRSDSFEISFREDWTMAIHLEPMEVRKLGKTLKGFGEVFYKTTAETATQTCGRQVTVLVERYYNGEYMNYDVYK